MDKASSFRPSTSYVLARLFCAAITRDASTAEFYESLFGADEEDDALTKKCRGGSFLKQEPATPLSPTPKASCF